MCKVISSAFTKLCAECILLACVELFRFIMSFRLDFCCGCINLRAGSLIIGYLSLIAEFIVVLFCGLGLITGSVVADGGKELDKEDFVLVGGFIIVLSAILLVFTVLYIVFTIVLLIGLHKDRRGNIKAFLVFSTFFVVLCFVIWTAEFWDPPVDPTFMFGFFCVNMVSVYFLLVIRSYYHKIDEQMKPLSEYGP